MAKTTVALPPAINRLLSIHLADDDPAKTMTKLCKVTLSGILNALVARVSKAAKKSHIKGLSQNIATTTSIRWFIVTETPSPFFMRRLFTVLLRNICSLPLSPKIDYRERSDNNCHRDAYSTSVADMK